MSGTQLEPVLAPDRDEARRWADEELSDPAYQESDLTLLERLGEAFANVLDRIFTAVEGVQSPWLIAVVAAIVLAGIALIIWRVQRGSGGSLRVPQHEIRVLAAQLDPDELRARARAAAQQGRWNLAVQEGVRALMAELARAGAIDIEAASTASELAQAAAAARPAHAQSLLAAGDAFDSVTFGEGVADQDVFRQIEQLDAQLQQAVPA